jgi:uncharacterized damage-inducible protein DinB
MTSLELCRKQRSEETAKFVKVLKAMPEGRLDYRPDPKSRTAAELSWMLAQSEAALVSLLETGEIRWAESKPPATADAIVSTYEKNAQAVNERLANIDESGWDKKGRFLMGADAPPWEDTVGAFVWGFLFDSIHHRGQLTTYLRPMGGKVPAIYGPSADDSGQ